VVSPQRPPFEVPRPYFQAKNITHREEVIGFPADAPERLAIMFDLKEVSVAPLAPKPGMPTAFPRAGAIKAIDNPRVTEWDYTWAVGQPVAAHLHDRDSVQVFFEGGTIKFTRPDGKAETKTFASGDARFIPRGTVDTEEALSGSPRAITIELK
jgi:quercetin dioxygenase-like cupin family protein